MASVTAVSHDCDLALLRVDEDAFWADLRPVELGGLPQLRDRVTVVGFPVGGEQVSYTQGVVSRIEFQRYSHAHSRLLALTVDAAINSGNSGGPAIAADGRLVGIAFQKLSNADNIGHLVPMVLVRRFLEAVTAGRSLEAPSMGIRFQTLENPALCTALGVPSGQTGVRVVEVGHGGAAWGKLRRDDVVLELAGRKVAGNGTVAWQDGLRTHLAVLLSDLHVGDRINLRFVRGGEVRTARLKLGVDASLVPRCRYDVEPRWFVFGGLVFQPLTLNYLETWTKLSTAPRDMVTLYRRGMRKRGHRESIVLTSVLAHALTAGLENLADQVVETVDGRRPVDLASMLAALDAAREPVHIGFSSGALAVMDPQAARAARVEVLQRYGVPHDRSSGLELEKK